MMTQILALILLSVFGLVSCTTNETNKYYNAAETPSSPESPSNTPNTNTTVEGVINGGGGKGALCMKKGEKQLSVLDLYEGSFLYDLSYEKHKPKNEQEMLELVKRLSFKHLDMGLDDEGTKENHEDFSKRLDELYKGIRYTKKAQRLKDSKDSFEPVIDTSCEVVQIALYYDESVLIVDQEYWDMLDWQNRAALLLHEMMYFMARQGGETNSMQTRKLVGHMMSDKGLPGILGGAYEKPESVLCRAYQVDSTELLGTDTEFVVHKVEVDGEKKTEIRFTFINDNVMLLPLVGYTHLEPRDFLPHIMRGKFGTKLLLNQDTYRNTIASFALDFRLAPTLEPASPNAESRIQEDYFIAALEYNNDAKDIKLAVSCRPLSQAFIFIRKDDTLSYTGFKASLEKSKINYSDEYDYLEILGTDSRYFFHEENGALLVLDKSTTASSSNLQKTCGSVEIHDYYGLAQVGQSKYELRCFEKIEINNNTEYKLHSSGFIENPWGNEYIDSEQNFEAVAAFNPNFKNCLELDLLEHQVFEATFQQIISGDEPKYEDMKSVNYNCEPDDTKEYMAFNDLANWGIFNFVQVKPINYIYNLELAKKLQEENEKKLKDSEVESILVKIGPPEYQTERMTPEYYQEKTLPMIEAATHSK